MKSATEQKKAPSSALERVRSLNRQVKDRLAEATPPGGSSNAQRLAQIMARSDEIRELLKSPGIGYNEARELLDEGNNLWWEANKLATEIDGAPQLEGDSVDEEALKMARTYREERSNGGFFTIGGP